MAYAHDVCDGIAGVMSYEPLTRADSHNLRIHRQIKRIRGVALSYACIQCGEQARTWAWQHGNDPMSIYSYEPMCYGCHTLYDFKDTTSVKLGISRLGNTNARGTTYNRGTGNGMSKLTAADVLEIRQLREMGMRYKDIAARFDLHPMSVGQIVRRERWRHI